MKWQPLLAWELARKDVKLFFADRQAALLCFAVPIVLASAFGAIFHRPANASLPRLPLALVCEESGEEIQRLIECLRSNPEVEAEVMTREKAFDWLGSRSAGAIVLLPDHLTFSRAAPPAVSIFTLPGNEFQGRWAEGLLTEAYLQVAARAWLGLKEGERLARPLQVCHERLPGTEAIGINSFSHSFCGMTLQYLLFWGMDSGLLLLRERKRGLWRRMRAAPVGLATILASKVLSTGFIALLQITCTFGFGWLVFGVRISGSLAGFALLALTAALLSAATGLLVAGLGGNEARARSLSIIVILSLSLLGGLWLPFAFLPEWAQRLAIALPTTWAAQGFEGVTWRGMGLGGAVCSSLAVIAFCVLFLAVALWRLRRDEARVLCKGES